MALARRFAGDAGRLVRLQEGIVAAEHIGSSVVETEDLVARRARDEVVEARTTSTIRLRIGNMGCSFGTRVDHETASPFETPAAYRESATRGLRRRRVARLAQTLGAALGCRLVHVPPTHRQPLLLRDAQPSDAEAVARVHVRTWQMAYRGLLPDAYLDSLRPEDRARRYTFGNADPGTPQTIVALDREELVGFATVVGARGEASSPELSALHVDPSHWGRGIGAALIAAARARLVREGCSSAHLWLLEGNTRAERFYRIDGWLPDGTQRPDVVWGAAVVEIGFRRDLP